MHATSPRFAPRRSPLTRRDFLKRTGWAGAGATALAVGVGPGRAPAQTASPYADWIPASPKPPKKGGVLTRASAWDPPVIDPRLTQSVGLFQFAGLVSNRLLRYAFTDEATGANDMSLKGDLAEAWSSSPDARVWTFKIRHGVKWQNVPPVKGRELVAADIKYCFEAYAKGGVQAFTFQEIEGMETPDSHTLRVHLKTPNSLFAQNVAEPVTIVFPREVLEEDGDLKKRMIGTGPYILKEHTRKVRLVLQRNPNYFDAGRPYIDEYLILSTPDAATRLAAFRTDASNLTWVAAASEVEAVRKTNPATVVQELRSAELYKTPGISETLDWVAALVALDRQTLDAATIEDTLGAVLKAREDIEAIRGERLTGLLSRAMLQGVRQSGSGTQA